MQHEKKSQEDLVQLSFKSLDSKKYSSEKRAAKVYNVSRRTTQRR